MGFESVEEYSIPTAFRHARAVWRDCGHPFIESIADPGRSRRGFRRGMRTTGHIRGKVMCGSLRRMVEDGRAVLCDTMTLAGFGGPRQTYRQQHE